VIERVCDEVCSLGSGLLDMMVVDLVEVIVIVVKVRVVHRVSHLVCRLECIYHQHSKPTW
jgi:hypothetical protein